MCRVGHEIVKFIDHVVDVVNHVNYDLARLAKVQCHSQVVVLETASGFDLAMTSVQFVQPM